MNKAFINIVVTPREINTIDQAKAELGSFKKVIISPKKMTSTEREYIAARCRIIREKFTSLRDDVGDIFQALINSCPEGERVYNTNFKVGSRHSATWWQKESERLYGIIKPSIKNFTVQKARKNKNTPKGTTHKSTLRNDVPIYIITGITGKKQPIEEATGFEVNEILAERWAPNLKRIQAVCEATQKSDFGVIAFLCKNTCHAVSEIAIKKTKGISNWKVIKIFKNNTAEIAATIKSAIATAGIAV